MMTMPLSMVCVCLPPGVGLSNTAQSMQSRPKLSKLETLVHCQLVEEEGRVRAMRAARSLGERTVTELILQHQNPQQLSSNLWAAVRARGCQFLGPGKMRGSYTHAPALTIPAFLKPLPENPNCSI